VVKNARIRSWVILKEKSRNRSISDVFGTGRLPHDDQKGQDDGCSEQTWTGKADEHDEQ
jgi:hypothetical protein